MNRVLRRPQGRELLTRPARPIHGRELPSELTRAGRARLRAASVAVRAVERELFSPLSAPQQRQAHEHLAACVAPRPEPLAGD